MKETEIPNFDLPDILDDPMEKASLGFSMPELDLSVNRPMYTNKKFMTHVCSDGPTGPWNAEGYFGSVENVGLVRSLIYMKMLNVQPVEDGCG